MKRLSELIRAVDGNIGGATRPVWRVVPLFRETAIFSRRSEKAHSPQLPAPTGSIPIAYQNTSTIRSGRCAEKLCNFHNGDNEPSQGRTQGNASSSISVSLVSFRVSTRYEICMVTKLGIVTLVKIKRTNLAVKAKSFS